MTGNGANSKAEAQQRADRIAAFRLELAELAREGVLVLADDEHARVDSHQDAVLRSLAERFAIDANAVEKQLSLGMRVASFLGALLFAASAVLFVRRFWGVLAPPAQVALLLAGPVLGCLATAWVARHDRNGYFTSLTALVTFSWFVLDLATLADVFSITPSAHAFLAWGVLALILAYAYDLRLLLAAGIGMIAFWLAAMMVILLGSPWSAVGNRPESFVPAGLLACALPLLLARAEPHRRYAGFLPVYRIVGLLAVLTPVLVLAVHSDGSFFAFLDRKILEPAYQVAGLVLSVAVIAAGIRWRWRDTVSLGATFFILFVWAKLSAWFWSWMPKYLFVLIFGLIAAAALWALDHLRKLASARSAAGGLRA